MTASRSSATSDPMALLCLIGGAVRSAGEWNLLMQLLVIANLCPQIRHALLAWLATEERYAGLEFEAQQGVVEDGWGGEDGLYRGFMTPKGRVLLWRHVTRFGLAVMIPVVTAALIRPPDKLVLAYGWNRNWLLEPLAFFTFFSRGLATGPTCVLIVPVS